MREFGARRVAIDGIEVELHDSAFAARGDAEQPAASAEKPGDGATKRAFAPEAQCACGHPETTEHNPEGLCLHGCPVALCEAKLDKPPEE